MMRVLLLGGTTEAGMAARALCDAGIDAVYSYAGRTSAPVAQPLPTRIGGFGGVAGLVNHLRAETITHLVDATHPFAEGMSRNAVAAARHAGIPLLALERDPWVAQAGDAWIHVRDTHSAVAALPDAPARVFLAIGKQQLHPFAAKPQHHYLLRLVDAPGGALPLPDCSVVIARGPFTPQGDTDLMRSHGITHVVAKNAGGTGASAKLAAARRLGLPVVMAQRPGLPPRETVATAARMIDWLVHGALRGV